MTERALMNNVDMRRAIVRIAHEIVEQNRGSQNLLLVGIRTRGVPTRCATFGQPPCGHEYVFNNHGSLTVTDRDHFLAGVRVLVRVFAGFPVMGLT